MLNDFLKLVKGSGHLLIYKSLLGVLITATYVAQSIIISKIVYRAIADNSFSGIALAFGIIAGLYVIRMLLLWTREILGKYVAGKVKETIRVNLFEKLFVLGPEYLFGERTGKVQSIFIDGVEALDVFLIEYIPQVLVTVTGVIIMSGYILYLDPAIGLMIFSCVAVCVICPMFWDKLMQMLGIGHWDSYGNLNSQFIDSMQGMQTLKAFNADKRMGEQLQENAQSLYHHTLKKLNVSLTSSGIVGFAAAAGTSLSIGFGALHVSHGSLSAQCLLVILFLSAESFRPVNELNRFWHKSFLGMSAAEKMFDFQNADSKSDVLRKELTGDNEEASADHPEVKLEDITFSYEDNGEVLQGVSLSIKPDYKTALVGESGCGKSTIVSLLMGFLESSSGDISINGISIRKMPLKQLRSYIAVVFQDTYLFNGTIYDNVRIAKPDATNEEVENVCKQANAHGFISDMPEGYNTVVGERGTRLSGGEKQRIAIARALLKNAPILILDEATSNLDKVNEKEIQESLDFLMKGRTTLVIAHRLSTIMNADEICVLKDGHIVERGKSDELLRKKGHFYELVQAQNREGGM